MYMSTMCSWLLIKVPVTFCNCFIQVWLIFFTKIYIILTNFLVLNVVDSVCGAKKTRQWLISSSKDTKPSRQKFNTQPRKRLVSWNTSKHQAPGCRKPAEEEEEEEEEEEREEKFLRWGWEEKILVAFKSPDWVSYQQKEEGGRGALEILWSPEKSQRIPVREEQVQRIHRGQREFKTHKQSQVWAFSQQSLNLKFESGHSKISRRSGETPWSQRGL